MPSAIDRRKFLEWTTAAAMLGSIDLPASSQVIDPRPPTVDISNPSQIAEGVWLLRDHRVWLVPNIAIIAGKDSVLVIDTGLGPANGEKVLDTARRLAGSRRLFLTITHFHPEHGSGAQVFHPNATIVYNRAQRDELIEKGVRYIELFRKTQSKAAADALDGSTLVMPHFVYEGDKAELDLGGRKVEFHAWGKAHTRGDQIVYLPDERILFTGDLIEERMFPIFPWFPPADVDVDSVRWIASLEGMQRLQPRLLVPGHGDPGDSRIALNLSAHIRDVDRRVRGMQSRGASAEQIVAGCKPQIMAAYPNWEHPGLLDWELNYFAARKA